MEVVQTTQFKPNSSNMCFEYSYIYVVRSYLEKRPHAVTRASIVMVAITHDRVLSCAVSASNACTLSSADAIKLIVGSKDAVGEGDSVLN